MSFYSKFIILGLLIIGMASGMVGALSSFHNVSQRIATHTTLSAWSLAQLELEYQKFCTELQLYRAGRSSAEQLTLAYDLAWNRMDVFLNGTESKLVRENFGAQALIQRTFGVLQQYEPVITALPPPESAILAEWERHSLALLPEIRKLMVLNFTGRGATRGMEAIDLSVRDISWGLAVLSLLSLLMSYLLFREARQHWFLSLHDSLTGLTNRARLPQLLKERCHQSSIRQTSVSLCLLNVLRFHEVNNLFGYQNGDQLLRRLSDILRQKAGKTALIARTGSSEFALLLPGQQVTTLLPEIMQALEVVLKEYDPAHRMRLCCGISTFPEQCTSPVELFQFAELALAGAKKNSAVSVQHFNIQMQSTFQRRRELATQLRAELQAGSPAGLYLCYQPIHVVDDPHSLGIEVLLRWKHASFGFVSPPEVIEIAEEHGLGDVLGDWIFRQVIMDLSSLPSSILPRLSVAVNLSESMFSLALSDRVVQLFRQGPLRPQQLVLELTETIALHDFSVSQQILTSLREAGIRIALDDFGTGYSSLAYLKELPVDKLKLDKSFIQQIHLDTRQLQLVQHITELAHDLGLTVVAEGVESAAEREIVIAIGVDEIQGYHYSRPLELPQLRHYLQRCFPAETTV